MELLVIVLHQTELLNDILELFLELEINRGIVLDSESVGHHLAYDVPIFAGIRQLVGEAKKHNRTIMALLKKNDFQRLLKLLKEEEIDFSNIELGFMFSIPVNNFIEQIEED